jgi:hypothetical protein
MPLRLNCAEVQYLVKGFILSSNRDLQNELENVLVYEVSSKYSHTSLIDVNWYHETPSVNNSFGCGTKF